ncbi:MAG: MazG-like family protein [Syntrophomonadaceae bacterium]
MDGRSKELDIARNLKMVDWLKAELIESVAELFKALLKKGNEAVAEALASIMIICYLLGQRVGVNFLSVDSKVKEKLRISIDNSVESDNWQKELAGLLFYLQKK